MATLVEQFDPQVLTRPLQPLLERFAASAYTVAPERTKDLQSFVDQKGLRIRLDTTTDHFDVYASELIRRINFPLSALERLWGYAYCHTKFFDLYKEKGASNLSNFTPDSEWTSVARFVLWTHEAETTGTCPPWPDDTPRPSDAENDDRAKFANNVFLQMTGFILLHEIAHLLLGHFDAPPQTQEASLAQEFEADMWAADWILTDYKQHNDDQLEFVRRTMGIAHALATVGAIESHAEAMGERTHPNPAARLLAILDKWIPLVDSEVLPVSHAAWKVGPHVLHLYLLKAGKALDVEKVHPSYRSYLEDVQALF